MIGLVDEQKDFVFLHEDPVTIFWHVLEVVDHADKKLVGSHGVAVAAAEALKHGENITDDDNNNKNEVKFEFSFRCLQTESRITPPRDPCYNLKQVFQLGTIFCEVCRLFLRAVTVGERFLWEEYRCRCFSLL